MKSSGISAARRPGARPLLRAPLLRTLLAASLGLGMQLAVAQVRSFDIPAQALDASLSQLARQAGVQLLVAPELLAGRTAPAVRGELDVADAFGRALAGSGLVAVREGGTVVIRRAPRGDATLGAVTVTAAAGSATEGSSSYATRASRSATGLELSQRQTPQAVSVMTRQRLDDQAANEMLAVLEQTPGVVIEQGGPIGSDANAVYARGFQVSNFQVDGITRASNYGFNDEVSDMVVFDRVEIVRGATGLMSGIGDPSATVNLVRKRPTAEFAASVTGQVGAWDTWRTEFDVSGPLTEQGHVRGRLVGARQEGDSFIDRQHVSKEVLYGIVEADVAPRTQLTLGVEYQKYRGDEAARSGLPLFHSDGSTTNLPRSFNSATEWAYLSRRNLSAFATLEHYFDNDWNVRLDLERSEREYDDVLGYALGGNPDKDTGAGVSIWAGRWAAEPRQTSFSLTASGPFELFGRSHELMLGINGYDASQDGPNYPLWWFDDYDTSVPDIFTWQGRMPKPDLSPNGRYEFEERQLGGYLAARLRPTDALALIVGSRVGDWERKTRSSYFDGGSSSTSRAESGVVTPYLGVVYDLDEQWSVYASYTSIFKPQDYKDRAGTYLEPLEGVNHEAGLKGELYGGRLNTSVAVYRAEQDNLAVADGGFLAPDGNQAYRAEKGATARGIELEAAGELLPRLQLGASYSHTEIENADGDRLLTYLPRDTFKLFSTWRFDGGLSGLTIGGNLRWQGRAHAEDIGPNGEDFRQGALTLVDLMARYRISRNLSAQLNLRNVFDRKYYTSISWAGNYGEPRNATLSLKYDWQ